jgi:hypothetical protein
MDQRHADPRTLERLAFAHVQHASGLFGEAAKKLALTQKGDIPLRIAHDVARAKTLQAMLPKEDS